VLQKPYTKFSIQVQHSRQRCHPAKSVRCFNGFCLIFWAVQHFPWSSACITPWLFKGVGLKFGGICVTYTTLMCSKLYRRIMLQTWIPGKCWFGCDLDEGNTSSYCLEGLGWLVSCYYAPNVSWVMGDVEFLENGANFCIGMLQR